MTTLLPIAARELRVASRRRVTFHVRLGMAFVGALLAFGLLAFTDVTRSSAAGKPLFMVMSVTAFAFALLAGVFLAADAISEEKRDGTLGLLFLTDLNGFDIVAGKLLIVGLNAFLALTTVLPVMAVAWLLGGVTGGEFWRVALALLNTLFLSLAVGLAVSSQARSQARALVATFAVLVGFTAVLGAVDFGLKAMNASLPWRFVSGASPVVAFSAAGDLAYRASSGRFWSALWAMHLAGWLFLGLAGWLVTRRWQANPEVRQARWAGALRRDLLDVNPVTALLVTDRQVRGTVWAVVVAVLMCLLLNIAVGGNPLMPFAYLPWMSFKANSLPSGLLSLAVTALIVILKTLFAWQACHFFALSRRHGALDPVLSTPLTDDEILGGHWSALRRLFVVPMLLLTGAVTMAPLVQAVLVNSGAGGSGTIFDAEHVGAWGLWLYTMVSLPLELIGIAWLGLWISLTGRRPAWAFAKTTLFAVVLPLLLFCVPNLLLAGVILSFARARMTPPIRALLEGPVVQWRRNDR